MPDIEINQNFQDLSNAPAVCSTCNAPLCLRKQVINLALGNTETMYCLLCLSKMENNPPQEILLRIKSYILGRECFKKEWIKYVSEDDCPDPKGCFIQECFAK